jgi:hypothetical protein
MNTNNERLIDVPFNGLHAAFDRSINNPAITHVRAFRNVIILMAYNRHGHFHRHINRPQA